VRLCVINSSTGEQVARSVADSPESSVPRECFFGDPLRLSFRAVGAEVSAHATLLRGLAVVPAVFSQLLSLVLLGGVLGKKKQALTSGAAAWQQGANALFAKQTGKVLYRHLHRHPLDIGQPVEETAKGKQTCLFLFFFSSLFVFQRSGWG
jgi:hypothetical protein